MPELTSIQEELLRVIRENIITDMFGSHCDLTSAEIIKEMKVKPAVNYLTRALRSLEKKGKIKVKTSYEAGHQGLKRIIKVL